MKPENYSLKAQNSLADCRITPGSQRLIATRSNAAIPKGARALRRPTKAELRTAKGRVSKHTSARKAVPVNSAVTPLVELLSKKVQKKANATAYAEQRAAEKKSEVESAASIKGILKTKTTTSETKAD